MSWISISFDRVAEVYDRTRGLPAHVMERLVETLKGELADFKYVLDFGVGTGRFAKPLQDLGFGVVGIDISRKMMVKAREKGVGSLFLSDARFLPFRVNCFDAAVSVHLLHLIGEWESALRELCRVTMNVMVSLSYEKQDPVREAYNSLLKERGYEHRRPGKSEQDLITLVHPARKVFVCSYATSADERLNNLMQRVFSGQWEIPGETVATVVEQLRDRFAGNMFTQELYLSVWKIADLKSYLQKTELAQRRP